MINDHLYGTVVSITRFFFFFIIIYTIDYSPTSKPLNTYLRWTTWCVASKKSYQRGSRVLALQGLRYMLAGFDPMAVPTLVDLAAQRVIVDSKVLKSHGVL